MISIENFVSSIPTECYENLAFWFSQSNLRNLFFFFALFYCTQKQNLQFFLIFLFINFIKIVYVVNTILTGNESDTFVFYQKFWILRERKKLNWFCFLFFFMKNRDELVSWIWSGLRKVIRYRDGGGMGSTILQK